MRSSTSCGRDAGLNAAERLSDHKFINFDKDTWGYSGTYY